MFALAALAAAVQALPQMLVSTGPSTEARATVRIVVGVRLKLDGRPNEGAPAPRDAIVKTSGGAPQTARLIEFQ